MVILKKKSHPPGGREGLGGQGGQREPCVGAETDFKLNPPTANCS